MTTFDQFGLATSVSNPKALEYWDDTILSFLSHSANVSSNLELALKNSELFPLPHIASGYFCMLLGQRSLVESAIGSYEKAIRQAKVIAITAREQTYLDGLDSLIKGNHLLAINLLKKILKKNPEDGFAAKLVHAIQFIIGDAKGMRSTLEDIIESYTDDNPAKSYVEGCYAFALEETGDYNHAEKIGRQAFEIANNDAWALHAVAHVYEMTGQVNNGINWLQNNSSTWSHCNNFKFHCWWHLALFYLDQKEYDKVLSLYDKEIRNKKTDDYRDIANGASLLARLEFERINVGDRWDELAKVSEKHTADNCLVFADLHYMLSLTAGNRTQAVEVLSANIKNFAETNKSFMSKIASEVGVSVMAGITAYQQQNYLTAFQHLSKAWPKLQKIGGSHAQRDVFERLTIESAIRSGCSDIAEKLLTTRLDERGALDGYAKRKFATIDRMRNASQLMQDSKRYELAG